jgi:hypothetical protein
MSASARSRATRSGTRSAVAESMFSKTVISRKMRVI